MNEMQSEADENKNGDDLQQDHYVICFGGFADPAYENDGEQHNDDQGGKVKSEMPTGAVKRVSLQVSQAARKIGWNDPAKRRMNAKPIQQIDHVGGKAHADGHVRNGILENQTPADDPCDELAHCRVGVGVGAACNRNHGSELGVTQRSKPAN